MKILLFSPTDDEDLCTTVLCLTARSHLRSCSFVPRKMDFPSLQTKRVKKCPPALFINSLLPAWAVEISFFHHAGEQRTELANYFSSLSQPFSIFIPFCVGPSSLSFFPRECNYRSPLKGRDMAGHTVCLHYAPLCRILYPGGQRNEKKALRMQTGHPLLFRESESWCRTK